MSVDLNDEEKQMPELTERQKEIIGAAIQIISQHGLMGFSIRKLADRVGVTEAAIYRHFKNKADLMANTLMFMRANEEHAMEWAEELPAMDAIEKLHTDRVEFAHRNPEISDAIWRIRASQIYSRLSGEDLKIRRRREPPIAGLVARGQTEGSTRDDISSELIADIIRRTMHGLMHEWHSSGFDFDLLARWKDTWGALRKMIEVVK